MTIKTFNKAACDMLRSDINGALEKLSELHGIDIKCRNMSFTDNAITAKVEMATINEDGATNTREIMDFKEQAQYYGLAADDLGKTFKSNGSMFEICGLKPRSSKYPILAKETVSGSIYKFRAADVASKVGGAA